MAVCLNDRINELWQYVSFLESMNYDSMFTFFSSMSISSKEYFGFCYLRRYMLLILYCKIQ